SSTSTTSAAASTGFWRCSFHWLPWYSGSSAGKFTQVGTDSSTPAPTRRHNRTSASTARGFLPTNDVTTSGRRADASAAAISSTPSGGSAAGAIGAHSAGSMATGGTS